MPTDDDLERIARQERELQWTSFSEDDAWELGSTLRELAAERQLAIVIDIRRFAPHFGNHAGPPLFFVAMRGTTPDNAEWARRKANVVARLHRSSYAVGLALKTRNTTLEDKYGWPAADYASHGGAFPITLVGSGVIGSITVSGLPQRDDHELVVEALCLERNRQYADLRLPELS
ncbi:MAG TPA: heme-degrading domain-containing protein [Acidobacteriaceae bacterium]